MESRIVASLDLTDKEKLLALSETIGKQVFAIKINWPTILSAGKSIIGELSSYSKVICDFKLADIPNTIKLIAKQIADQDPYAIICHPFVGSDSLKELVSTGIRTIGVVAMSNEGASEHLNKHWKELLSDVKGAGAYGIIAAGNNYTLLKEISSQKEHLKVFSPGVGAQGGSAAESIKKGSDYIIVGRAIYDSADPVSEIKKINSEIQ